jgi:hypothetical protein
LQVPVSGLDAQLNDFLVVPEPGEGVSRTIIL